MISGTKNRSQTLDSPSDTIEVKHEGEPEIGSLKNNSASEVTHEWVNERIKMVTQPILRQVKKLCALLEIQNKFETTGNSEATSSRRDGMSAISADNRCDSWSNMI